LTRQRFVTVELVVRKDGHDAGHLYDRVAERLHHQGYVGLARHFRAAAADERGVHSQKIEDLVNAFDIDPPHPSVEEPDLSDHQSVLDLVYFPWITEAGIVD
jgi:ferritin